jgi:histo-blood group ABO system transferase
MKIALLNIATNKYISFLPNLYTTADQLFLKNHDVDYFLFSNLDFKVNNCKRNVITRKIEHKPWPYMTLYRYKFFVQAEEQLKQYDYLYYCDADMYFFSEVGDEILSDRVGTLHPGFFNKDKELFTYEKNPQSTAFLSNKDGEHYYAGGFNGGSSSEFLKMAKTIDENISKDEANNIIAKWHDESHLNKYLSTNKPTNILSPLYCFPDRCTSNMQPKIIAITKNHELFRSET